ncbi:helix-turn-helix domain-containing protein [Micromonospora sp. HM5-17]|uniref:helix-turn-helix domain-containing protein n=1 Tax=Micromonospora sp. HM5-17 TaxID=2487710 RepID=UPI000F465416|nr:helix-turn-helix domain-containing protein [Micromonospora sp. HM5-17]ROT25876.1 DNA-binding protein [Micromonospora sp. HM5-17]
MIVRVEGEEYGTAAELAAVLGPDVTPATIRRWAERAGLPAYRDGRTVRYPL